jgi:hypothetical protein
MPRKFSSYRLLTDAEEAEIQRMIASDPGEYGDTCMNCTLCLRRWI